LCEKVKFRKFN